MEAIPETIGHILEAQKQRRLVVENQDSDLSEGESRVLQVQLELKGETVSRSKKPQTTH